MTAWPSGARGALCLSFDNLGEAAAIEMGALAADDPSVGRHPTVTQTLPSLLGMLGERELAATFFVEGLNAELYPEALHTIAARGHEVAYHAWRHESWEMLSPNEQAENLARGQAAFRKHGLEIAGLRPPGGQLGADGLEVLRKAGLRYASPAGAGAGVDAGVALLPFEWRHVDATCVIPALGPIREQMTTSKDPLGPDAYIAYLEGELSRLVAEGGFATLVLHLPMLDWWGEERVAMLLGRVAEANRDGALWLAPCAKAAEHVLAHPDGFRGGASLDPASWAS